MTAKFENVLNAKLIAVTQPVIEGMNDASELIAYCARVSNPSNQVNMDTAPKLIAYLKKYKHWSPFEMANAVVEVECTRDIVRQLLRHRSFSFQEFSQRYASVESLGEAFCIREPRMQDTKNRQNSVEITGTDEDSRFVIAEWQRRQQEVIDLVSEHYKWAVGAGIAKECARVILPEGNTLSRAYVNGTIRSWIHYFEVRMEQGVTQKEHVMLATLIAKQVAKAFPVVV